MKKYILFLFICFNKKCGPPGKEVGARPILHTDVPDGSAHGPSSSVFVQMVCETENAPVFFPEI